MPRMQSSRIPAWPDRSAGWPGSPSTLLPQMLFARRQAKLEVNCFSLSRAGGVTKPAGKRRRQLYVKATVLGQVLAEHAKSAPRTSNPRPLLLMDAPKRWWQWSNLTAVTLVDPLLIASGWAHLWTTRESA
jgi:hypothetical protein